MEPSLGVLRSGASRQLPVKAVMVIDLRAQSTAEFQWCRTQNSGIEFRHNYSEHQI
jgi:hypothetical protein